MKHDFFYDHPTPSTTPTLHSQRYDVQLMPVSAILLRNLNFSAALKIRPQRHQLPEKFKKILFNDAMMRANLFQEVNVVIFWTFNVVIWSRRIICRFPDEKGLEVRVSDMNRPFGFFSAKRP
jgi:hypothetical protein